MKMNRELNVKYAVINAFYFMLFCGSGSYGYNFLKFSGFSTALIGTALTFVSILTLVIQSWMAPIIDRSQTWNEKKQVLLAILAAVALYALMPFLPAGSMLLLAVSVIGFALTMSGMPFLNSLAFAYEREGEKINYGIGRGIGSAAYAIGGVVIGWLVSWQGGQNEMIVKVLPYYMIVTGLAAAGCLLTIKDPQKVKGDTPAAQEQISYLEFFKKYKKIFIPLSAIVMIFFCHMLVNTYMIDIIKEIGGNTADQGNAIFIQSIVELPTMALFTVILKKFKVNALMIFGCVCFVLKYLVIYFAADIPVFYLGMVLQMVSYAVLIPASVYFAEEYVAPEDRNQGQAIVSASTTVGGMLASFFGGILLSVLSGHGVLLVGVGITVLGTAVMILGIRILQKQ